jgi:cytochrome P450
MNQPSVVHDPLGADGLHESWARLRAATPAHYLEQYGHWIVASAGHVEQVLRDPVTFSSAAARQVAGSRHSTDYPAELVETLARGVKNDSLLVLDPPLHSRVRKPLARRFSPKLIATREKHVYDVAHGLIDAFSADGAAELTRQFCRPLSMELVCDLIGIDIQGRDEFIRDQDLVIETYSPGISYEARLEGARADVRTREFLEQLIERRRAEPRDDLLSRLVDATAEYEDPLATDDLVALLALMVKAGFDTTGNLIASSIAFLLQQPAELAVFRRDPERLPLFIEEMLRFQAPVNGLFRTATRDVDPGGRRIRAGDRVQVPFGSACRDEERFSCPGEFDREREKVRSHLAFGTGIHLCVGAPLARLEGRIALQVLFKRLPDLHLAKNFPRPAYRPHYNIRFVDSLHVGWDPGSALR